MKYKVDRKRYHSKRIWYISMHMASLNLQTSEEREGRSTEGKERGAGKNKNGNRFMRDAWNMEDE
jgi:hypothetical protein